MDRTNPLEKRNALQWLDLLQRFLPVAILVVVALYELIAEYLFSRQFEGGIRFGLEMLVFGALGATVTWITLEWVRRRTEHDMTEREQTAEQIRALNRHLESLVAERTQALSQANEELRRRQRELEKANGELHQLDALKSEFVSLVSHELRAPLANISGSLQLLLDENETQTLSAHQHDMLALANDQAERLARLVKGILNVSRIEAGQMALQLEPFNILTVIDHALEQWAACAPEFKWRGPQIQNLPSVWADRDRVEEVLTNLLENARKYAKAGSPVSVDTYITDDLLIVRVTDQGQGIAPEELDKIFDKFHRVERDDARQTYGYGLGLYISHKLIDQMGGALWAESDLGHGSTFSFSLPLAGHTFPLHTDPVNTRLSELRHAQ